MKQVLIFCAVVWLVNGCTNGPVVWPDDHKSVYLGDKASPQKALVIGNGAYEFWSLGNTTNDAEDVANELAGMNFHVIRKLDLNRQEMLAAIQEFVELLKNTSVEGRVAFFFFAGHGTHVDKDNFLIPINNNVIKRSRQLQDAAVNVGTEIVAAMEMANENGVNLIVLDACRNNPFPTLITRGLDRGFVEEEVTEMEAEKTTEKPEEAPKGTMIAYAADIGETTLDGEQRDRNSVYTKHLLKKLREAKKQTQVNVRQMFLDVQKLVSQETGQTPWLTAELTDGVCIRSEAGMGKCQ